jgi:hypothetical protein
VHGGKVEHFELCFLTESPEAETLNQLTTGWTSGMRGKSKAKGASEARLLKTLPEEPTQVELDDVQAMWTHERRCVSFLKIINRFYFL